MGEIKTTHSFLITSLVLLLVFSISNLNFANADHFVTEFGSTGSGDGELENPNSLVIDSSGNLLIADTWNDRIVKFDFGGVFQGWLGGCTSGSNCDIANQRSNGFSCTASTCVLLEDDGDGQFSNPTGITLDSSENIYVTSIGDLGKDSSIQKFDSAGNFVSKIGSEGSGDGQFAAPWGIDFDSSGNIYFADVWNHRIQKFNSAGNFVSMFGWGVKTGAASLETCTSNCLVGLSGSGDGQLNTPRGIAIDSSNNIYVVDLFNNRIQKFDSNGSFLFKVGTLSANFNDGDFNTPFGIAVDSLDNFYVAETANDRIQKFNSTGDFQSKFGTFGMGNEEFNFPRGVALDVFANIYVADTRNDRIQKFGLPSCVVPGSEDMTVSTSCGLSASDTAPSNVIVLNGAVMTIPMDVTLTITSGNNITVQAGGGVLIKDGGTLQVNS